MDFLGVRMFGVCLQQEMWIRKNVYNKFRRLNVPRDCWIHIAPDEQTEFADF